MSGSGRSRRELDICEQALGYDGLDREKFLDRACAGDAELRKAADSLLAAITDSGTFMLIDIESKSEN